MTGEQDKKATSTPAGNIYVEISIQRDSEANILQKKMKHMKK